MTLEQIDQQIAKWKEYQSNVALKLVDLDEMPTYQMVRNQLFQGSTAIAVSQVHDAIDLMWTVSALVDDALAKINSMRTHTPLPWEKEKWIRDLGAKLTLPVIALPAPGTMSFSDTLAEPTLTLVSALTQVVNGYDRVLQLVKQIDGRIGEMHVKLDSLSKLSDQMGAPQFQREIADIKSQIEADPLGVSLDSFGTVETHLRRFAVEASERQAIIDSLNASERRINEINQGCTTAHQMADQCLKLLGTCRSIPTVSTGDLVDWVQTLRRKVPDSELAPLRVGLTKLQQSIEATLKPISDAESYNRSLVSRFQEVQGRFSAAQAKASAYRGAQSVAIDNLASKIRSSFAESPKDVTNLERLLETYERLVFQ